MLENLGKNLGKNISKRQLYKVILILDMFFLKYKGGGRGVNLILPTPQKELPSESPALLELSNLQQVAVRVEEQKEQFKKQQKELVT